MNSPNLDSVRNRRRRIWSQISALCEEDRDLYTAEKVLLRLSGTTEKASLPMTVLPPQMGTASTEMNALLSSSSYGITTRLHPAEFTQQDLVEAERDFANAEEEEEEEEEGEGDDDGGAGLVRIVRDVMTGNETLEQLTLLLMRNCGDTWWTASEIQSFLTHIKGREVPMASISPMLTNLKNNGVITRSGHEIALSERAKEDVFK
ncbi:hypothetical protein JJB99_23605 [Bradyrhizobium diazoefficiens]|uniref:hypothetical protein n=1 Tax=Bradyrhizobium diazoefficiens TaxID=1355477 RepID=UPI00190B64BD|nr:hypothetical protein [Bradyrhizobium diazoefficiens]QQO12452.1 hypothetical protein JJB99_23605 [Bradyrhizobium diazoefficiens]